MGVLIGFYSPSDFFRKLIKSNLWLQQWPISACGILKYAGMIIKYKFDPALHCLQDTQ